MRARVMLDHRSLSKLLHGETVWVDGVMIALSSAVTPQLIRHESHMAVSKAGEPYDGLEEVFDDVTSKLEKDPHKGIIAEPLAALRTEYRAGDERRQHAINAIGNVLKSGIVQTHRYTT